jgi:hypothetical protein
VGTKNAIPTQMIYALGIFQDLGCWIVVSSLMAWSQILWPKKLLVTFTNPKMAFWVAE